jgi:hypothetical protein
MARVAEEGMQLVVSVEGSALDPAARWRWANREIYRALGDRVRAWPREILLCIAEFVVEITMFVQTGGQIPYVAVDAERLLALLTLKAPGDPYGDDGPTRGPPRAPLEGEATEPRRVPLAGLHSAGSRGGIVYALVPPPGELTRQWERERLATPLRATAPEQAIGLDWSPRAHLALPARTHSLTSGWMTSLRSPWLVPHLSPHLKYRVIEGEGGAAVDLLVHVGGGAIPAWNHYGRHVVDPQARASAQAGLPGYSVLLRFHLHATFAALTRGRPWKGEFVSSQLFDWSGPSDRDELARLLFSVTWHDHRDDPTHAFFELDASSPGQGHILPNPDPETEERWDCPLHILAPLDGPSAAAPAFHLGGTLSVNRRVRRIHVVRPHVLLPVPTALGCLVLLFPDHAKLSHVSLWWPQDANACVRVTGFGRDPPSIPYTVRAFSLVSLVDRAALSDLDQFLRDEADTPLPSLSCRPLAALSPPDRTWLWGAADTLLKRPFVAALSALAGVAFCLWRARR